MIVAVWVAAVLVIAGAVLAIVRAERGPSMLDRTVALDIFVTCLVAAFALYAAIERRADVVPILVVLSLVGFVGSVSIARFAAVEPEDARRVRTREEVEAEEAERLAEQLAHLEEPAESDTPDDLDGGGDADSGEPGEEPDETAGGDLVVPEDPERRPGAPEPGGGAP